jgi:hypothetical protein
MKNCLSLATLLLALAQPAISLNAADSAPLNEHLKPITRLIGHWKWQWKNEHGESMAGQSTVQPDASGAFITDRGWDMHDGKVVSSELNIYYWDPAAKAIANVGFTATGDHGLARVFARGNQWIEHSAGYDDQGVLRTHIDHWEWSGDDTGSYQETHIFRAGRAEPDDFKMSCQRAATNLPAPVPGSFPLNEHLKPIARWIGTWDLEWKDAHGANRKARTTVEPDAQGAVIAERTEQVQDGQLVYSKLTVFYWQQESRSLATVTMDSTGSVLSANLFARGDKWVGHISGHQAEGKLRTGVAQHQWMNDHTVICQETDVFEEGEAKPDGPKYTCERVPVR